MPTEPNPRDIITPAAFAVAPDLLGVALARPWRRAAAILLDLLFCAIIAGIWQARSVFFAALAAFLVHHITRRAKPNAGWFMRMVGVSLRSMLAIFTFAVCVVTFGMIGADRDKDGVSVDSAARRATLELPLVAAGLTMAEARALFNATTPEEADVHAARVRDRLVANGLKADEARALSDALTEATADGAPLNPVAVDALRRALLAIAPPDSAVPETAAAPDADSLALAYAAALAAGDSAGAARIRPTLAEVLAADRIEAIERRNRRLQNEVERLEKRTADLEKRRGSVVAVLRAAITEDLGLGLGWLALYFTGFTVAWRGYTPGKRLFGIRVIRLDGQPLTAWQCFERFGGYSASLATGLLGFAQIFWDRNRQAIHDKIVATVVVRERPARRSAAEQPTGGGQPAAHGPLDRGSDEVVAGEGETGGEPVGVESGEVS